MNPNPKPGTGWNEALRQPVLGQRAAAPTTPPVVPAMGTLPPVPQRPVPQPPPPPMFSTEPLLLQRPARTTKRSILPMAFLLLLTAGSIAAAGYFALDSMNSKDKLAEANKNMARPNDDYLLTASGMVAERESDWERTKAAWAIKEKELKARTTTAENDAATARSEASPDLEKARGARSLAESQLSTTLSQLSSATSETTRLRSQLADSERKGADVLKTTSTDVRNWMQGLFTPLPQLDTREEVRVALRKHEMSKLFDAEKKKLDKSIVLGSGTLVLYDRGEMGLAFRGVGLRYTNLSAPMPGSIVEASYAYHWTVSDAATSFDADRDGEIAAFSAPAYGEEVTKEIRFDYKKSDDRYRHIESRTPFEYKNAKGRMVLAVKFKERGDPKTPRILIFKALTMERSN
ncbi:MAG: hypothetical protein EXS09_15875 [Gemmataceae bacterium]|nr:hypothetical protein [Gemmataceae bacterium]